MAGRAISASRKRKKRLRKLAPMALELSDLLAQLPEAPAEMSGVPEETRRRAAQLARACLAEADDLLWDNTLSQEFRDVLNHTSRRLKQDARVKALLDQASK
jgi:ABC-type uncharacterized transport system YnjBCD ATPase subunit